MKKLALILGSGFSAAAGLPTTNKLNEQFISPGPRRAGGLQQEDEDLITDVLKQFWRTAFGWEDGKPVPTLEEHFTQIDLAANSGHNLGPDYPPKVLRAIRRISIHRVFQLLDVEARDRGVVEKALSMAFGEFETSVVTLNWDIVVERALYAVNLDRQGVEPEVTPEYCVVDEVKNMSATLAPNCDDERDLRKFQFLRMHGASNWMYCDSCRRIFADLDEKSALQYCAYLEASDFDIFEQKHGYDTHRHSNTFIHYDANQPERSCSCGNRLAGRLATFSYRKAFSIYQFQVVWKRAFEVLRDADAWLMIGYSLPEADYEFKSLLKAAQLARRDPSSLYIEATTGKDPSTAERYARFFGNRLAASVPKRLADWVENDMGTFVEKFK